MIMYENLESLHERAPSLLKWMKPIPSTDVLAMRQRLPLAPGDYISFIKERGYGDIKESESSLPLFVVFPQLVAAAAEYFGDDGIYMRGPYENGVSGEAWLFGSDSTGTAVGFDSGDNWRLVEIDSMRWVTRLDLNFKEFIEGLLVCYPQRPVKFDGHAWYDSGGKKYQL